MEQHLPPGFSIIHSNHLEDLRQVVVQWIRSHPLKPLEKEFFIVQSNGMAQWLKLALAENEGCGISASLDIQLPARFLWMAYRAVLGADNIPRESPYDKIRLIWRLIRLLPSLLDDEYFFQLKKFLSDDNDLRKRYQLASHLADLYDQYQFYRADWLEDWGAGKNQLKNARGEAIELPQTDRWQAELWRRIQADVPLEQRSTSRSELHRCFLEAAESHTKRPAALPRRVIVFGISSLPQQMLEALQVLSRYSQVLLFVHNPCRHYWADILEDRELLRIERARHRRKAQVPEDVDLDLLHQHVNPLLAAWGKQGRDYIGLLYSYDHPETYRENFAAIDLFSDYVPPGHRGTLLQQVQQAVLDLQPLPAADEDRQCVALEDQSIFFHSAHSRQREMEILQDRLLSFFEQIPELKPRDIIVMMPDIDSYAPHIEAVFGNLSPQDPRFIPFTIADRPERDSIPMLLALEKLLQLPESRMTVSDLMDLLVVPAFSARFGLAEADLPRLHQWIEGAGIRWGINAGQRRKLGLPDGLEQNTWLFGLRRMLLGYAVGSGASWREIEPYDEIGGLEAALIGPLAAILEQLEKFWDLLRRPAAAADWYQRILNLMESFLLPMNSRDRLVQQQMEAVLEQWLNACTDAGLEENLTLPVVREALIGAMKDSSMSQRFLAGMVNFCTLMPMRAIPFKVVCLLGMNDGEYPRSHPPLDFDLMAAPGCYRPGDRSRREDDRYLFLEALLSAREKLYISYIGRSERDNSRRVPSVLVGQLRDYLAAGWRMTGSEPEGSTSENPLLDHLTCQHPLQPFSRTYFDPARVPVLFTYAHEWRETLDYQEEPTGEVPLAAPQFEGGLHLIDLVRFLKNPVQTFFNHRLNIYFDSVHVTTEDQESFILNHLAPFDLGIRLLDAGLSVDPSQCREAVLQAAERLRRAGELPLNGFGELAAGELAEPILSMLENSHHLNRQWPYTTEAMEIRLPVELEGCACGVLEDWLDGLHLADRKPLEPSRSAGCARWEFYPAAIADSQKKVTRLRGLLGLWVKHLAGCAQGICLTSYLVTPQSTVTLPPLDSETARNHLTAVIDHWWMGLSAPLPVTPGTASAYLKAMLFGNSQGNPDVSLQKAKAAARSVYEGNGFNSLGELGFDPCLRRVYPDFDTFWQTGSNHFLNLAEILYEPLVRALWEDR